MAYLDPQSSQYGRADTEGLLGISAQEYRVSKWSKTGFVAGGQARDGDVELRISTENQRGVRTLRGASSARWTLE